MLIRSHNTSTNDHVLEEYSGDAATAAGANPLTSSKSLIPHSFYCFRLVEQIQACELAFSCQKVNDTNDKSITHLSRSNQRQWEISKRNVYNVGFFYTLHRCRESVNSEMSDVCEYMPWVDSSSFHTMPGKTPRKQHSEKCHSFDIFTNYEHGSGKESIWECFYKSEVCWHTSNPSWADLPLYIREANGTLQIVRLKLFQCSVGHHSNSLKENSSELLLDCIIDLRLLTCVSCKTEEYVVNTIDATSKCNCVNDTCYTRKGKSVEPVVESKGVVCTSNKAKETSNDNTRAHIGMVNNHHSLSEWEELEKHKHNCEFNGRTWTLLIKCDGCLFHVPCHTIHESSYESKRIVDQSKQRSEQSYCEQRNYDAKTTTKVELEYGNNTDKTLLTEQIADREQRQKSEQEESKDMSELKESDTNDYENETEEQHEEESNNKTNVQESHTETDNKNELYKYEIKGDVDSNDNTHLLECTSKECATCKEFNKTCYNSYVCNKIEKFVQSTLFTLTNRASANKFCFDKHSCSLQSFAKLAKLYCKWWHINKKAENCLHTLRNSLQETENALPEKTINEENITNIEERTRKEEYNKPSRRPVSVIVHNVVSEDSALEAILQLRLHAAQERSTRALLGNEHLERELTTYHAAAQEQNEELEKFHNEQQHQYQQNQEKQQFEQKPEKSRYVNDVELISAKIRAQLARARQLRVEQLQRFYPITLCSASTHKNTLTINKKRNITLNNSSNYINNNCGNNGEQTLSRDNTEFIAQWPLPHFNVSIYTLSSRHFGNLYKYHNKFASTKDSNIFGIDTKKKSYTGSTYTRVASVETVNNNLTCKDCNLLKASKITSTVANERNGDTYNSTNHTNATSPPSSLCSHPLSLTSSSINAREGQTPWAISQSVVPGDVDGEGNALVCAGRVLRTLAELYAISLPHPIILCGVHSYVCSLYSSRHVDCSRCQSGSTSNTTLSCSTQNAILQKNNVYTDKVQLQESSQMQTWHKWPFFVKKTAQRSTQVQHAVELLIMDATEIAHAMGKFERLVARNQCSLGVILYILLHDN